MNLSKKTDLIQNENLNQSKNLKNGFRKSISMALIATLVLSSGALASAVTMTPMSPVLPQAGGQVQVYLKPDVTIIVDGQEKIFCDVNNEVVYPIIYNGSTYLPVRAISGLMGQDIEWNEEWKIVFMGRTFANPNKVKPQITTTNSISLETIELIRPNPSMITAYIRPNFLIMYDFELQTFNDERGARVYPIVVYGSVYLPIRAISSILKQTIVWDGVEKTITIDSPVVPVIEQSETSKMLNAQYEKQVTLYDSANVKIRNLQSAGSFEELMSIATEMSANYVYAAENTLAVKSMDTANFSEIEKAAYASLLDFSQISENYILVLENIAYMAAAEEDYSIMIETFMTLATESQSKLDETRELMKVL